MAIDIKLDGTNDIVIENGDLVLVDDLYEIIQSAKLRLNFVLGEWKLNETLGTDWFVTLFSMRTSYEQKKAEFKRVIDGTVGVISSTGELYLDPVEHIGEYQYTAQTGYGIVNGVLELII